MSKVFTSLISSTFNTTSSIFDFTNSINIKTGNGLILNQNNNINSITIKPPNIGITSYTLTLPPTSGTNGSVLTTNGSGVTSWSAINSLSGTTSTDITKLGQSAGNLLTSGLDSTIVGYNACSNTQTASSCVYIGKNSGQNAKNPNSNIAIGVSSGNNNNGTHSCIYIGSYAGLGKDDTTTGYNNIAIGSNALRGYIMTTASDNIAMGQNTLASTSTGSSNIAIGHNTAQTLGTGNNNILFGNTTGSTLTSGSDNILIGNNVKTINNTDSNRLIIGNTATTNDNIIIGDMTTATAQTLRLNADTTFTAGKKLILTGSTSGTISLLAPSTTSTYTLTLPSSAGTNGNVLITNGSGITSWSTMLNYRTPGTNSIYIGNSIGINAANPMATTAIGYNAGVNENDANSCTYIGTNAGKGMDNTTNSVANTAIGSGALGAGLRTTASNNVAIGVDALKYLTTATFNIGIGSCGDNLYTGTGNILIGHGTGANTSSLSHTINIGYQSGTYSRGSDNIFLGSYSGHGDYTNYTTNGSKNSAFGVNSLKNITTGSHNTVFGYESAMNITTGPFNTIIGAKAGTSLTTGFNNIIIGPQAGITLTTGSSNILIGPNVKTINVTDYNKLIIGMYVVTNENIIVADMTTAAAQTLSLNADTTFTAGKKIILSGSTSGTVSLQAPSTVTSYTLTLPSYSGSNGQVLVANGSGTTSWLHTNLIPLREYIMVSGPDVNLTLGSESWDILKFRGPGSNCTIKLTDNTPVDKFRYIVNSSQVSVTIGGSVPSFIIPAGTAATLICSDNIWYKV